MSYLEKAKRFFNEAQAVRRQIHENPEIGFKLPQTIKLIKQKLDEHNISYSHLGDTDAIVGTLGDAKKVKLYCLELIWMPYQC